MKGESKLYNKIYKCQNCGKVFKEEMFESDKEKIVLRIINTVEKKKIHYCNKDTAGVLELIAIKNI